MDLRKILEQGQGDSQNTEVIAFRISPAAKDKLLVLCKEQNVSLGRLFRAFVQELLEEA